MIPKDLLDKALQSDADSGEVIFAVRILAPVWLRALIVTATLAVLYDSFGKEKSPELEHRPPTGARIETE